MSPHGQTMNKFWKATKQKQTPHAHAYWNSAFDEPEIIESSISFSSGINQDVNQVALSTKGHLHVIREIHEETHVDRDRNDKQLVGKDDESDGEIVEGTGCNSLESVTSSPFKNRLNNLLSSSKVTKQNCSHSSSHANLTHNSQNQQDSLVNLGATPATSLHHRRTKMGKTETKKQKAGRKERKNRSEGLDRKAGRNDRSEVVERKAGRNDRSEVVDKNSGRIDRNGTKLLLTNNPVTYSDWKKNAAIESPTDSKNKEKTRRRNTCDTNKSVIIDVEPEPELDIDNTLRLNLNLFTSSKDLIDQQLETSSCKSSMGPMDSLDSRHSEGIGSNAGKTGPSVNREFMRPTLLDDKFEMFRSSKSPYNRLIYKNSIYHEPSFSRTQVYSVPSTLTSSLPSTPTSSKHQPPPIFHIPPPPPLEFAPSSLMSPYPIVTLPRRYRKERAWRVSSAPIEHPSLFRINLYRFFCQCLMPLLSSPVPPCLSPVPQYLPPSHTSLPVSPISRPPQVSIPPPPLYIPTPPQSRSLSRSSSVSCSCSSISSCSTCINVPKDPSAPHAFTLNPNKKNKSAQHCDQICLVVGSFVTIAVIFLTAILVYLALNTKVMTNGMTSH